MVTLMVITWWQKMGKLVILWVECKASKAETPEQYFVINMKVRNNDSLSKLTMTMTMTMTVSPS